jgi:hypothetical protein
VLVDSSLWVEYYRPGGRRTIQRSLREAVARDRVGIMAMILIEVLRGALSRESYEALESDLTALHWLEVTSRVARRGAETGFQLERAGNRVPATDLLIAATAVEYGYTLWHDDGHFEVIAEHTSLDQRRFRALEEGPLAAGHEDPLGRS